MGVYFRIEGEAMTEEQEYHLVAGFSIFSFILSLIAVILVSIE